MVIHFKLVIDFLWILEDMEEVKSEGIAGMRIVNEQLVDYHKTRIKIGTKGYFMEWLRKVAECEVIKFGERLQ